MHSVYAFRSLSRNRLIISPLKVINRITRCCQAGDNPIHSGCTTVLIDKFPIGLVQISSYTALGALQGELWSYGIVLGLGASTENWIGKNLLKKFSNEAFQKFIITVMVISGMIMLVRQFT